MNKFSVGDRVEYYEDGYTGTVRSVDEEIRVAFVDWDDGPYACHDYDELIPLAPEDPGLDYDID